LAFLSAPFLLFVLVTAVAAAYCPARLRPAVLIVASLAFYAVAGDPVAAALLTGLAAFTFWAARRVEAGEDNGPVLTLGVGGLFAVLLLFKTAQAGFVGRGGRLFGLLMPLGLSYVVFKLASYLIDVYWRHRRAERSLGNLTLYALFFPQIVSGPIQRAGHFLDQVGSLRVGIAGVERGLRVILFGLFQKVVADQIGVLVSSVYRAPASFSSLELLIGLYAFAFELYLDFAGITDMAIGLGALFGLETPHNFDRPFFATSIQDFWRRWHMTLSSWLADYLFTPLWHALRSWGSLGLVVAVLANMLAIGLWHGLRWTFVVFGLVNGVHMAISVLTRKRRNAFFKRHPRWQGLRAVTSRLATFHAMAAFFVFFRADSLATAGSYFRGLLFPPAALADRLTVSWSSLGMSGSMALALLGCVVVAEAVHWLRRLEWSGGLAPLGRGVVIAATAAVVVYMVLCRDSVAREFVYAQF
jgi:alginate O-acetyltransferase complex protein AlgI